VVALCTHSPIPVLLGDWVEPGAVVISVGSSTADRREVDDRLLERAARIVVDHRETELRDGGPVLRAVDLGLVRPEQLVELGQVLVGEDPGRRDASEVLFYNSVGLGVQDAAAAWLALQRVREQGLGTPIDLS
jgi:ornithine cyclodeaminase